MSPLRSSAAMAVAAGLVIAACSSGSGGGPSPTQTDGGATSYGQDPWTLDAIESDLLEGVDEPVIITEDELDQEFPLLEPLTELSDVPLDRDPTKGSAADLEAQLAAFTPTETWDDHFTFDTLDPGVDAALVQYVEKGILFGMANRDDFVPGFSLTAASSLKAGGKRFVVSLLTSSDPKWGFRDTTQACGGAVPRPTNVADLLDALDHDRCVPRVIFRVEHPTDSVPIAAWKFSHELAHVAQAYWSMSPAYVAAGGVKLAGAYHGGFVWQLEADAQFTQRHIPDQTAYDEPITECPFEPLRMGAFAWKDLSGVGTSADLPYETSVLVDQITWHRFAKDPSWIYRWLIATADPRTPPGKRVVPVSPARRLIQILSSDPAKVDLAGLNRVLVQSGVDLYARGKDPWTSSQLHAVCVRPSPELDLPAFSFDAVRVDPGDLSKVAKLHLALEAARDQSFVRAGVVAFDRSDSGALKYVDCLAALPSSSLGAADPRGACSSFLHPLAALTRKNEWKADVKLPLNFASGRYAIVAVVFHLLPRSDAMHVPIHVTFRAEPANTPPGRNVSKDDCGDITNDYRSHCKTSDCMCIGNAYCEGAVDPPPASCELLQRDCYVWCLFQKSDCDCASFCDVLLSRLACP